ncbi:MAG: IS110 family transposase [Gemmatimonadaceae bacterium]
MSFALYVGVDWADQKHRVCACSPSGEVLWEGDVEHDAVALSKLADRLVEMVDGEAPRIAVAIETPRGPVVSTLVERGMAVFALNPKQLDRFRDRHTVAGAKDDRRDAFVLSDSLRTDEKLYRRVRLCDADILELRELVRAREDLIRDRIAYGNRLRDQLVRYYVQVLELGSVYDEVWLWDLLERGPTPAEGSALSIAKIRSILKAHHIRRHDAEGVREILRRPPLVVAPGVASAASRNVKIEIAVLRTLHRSIKELDEAIATRLEALTTDDPQAPDEERKKHRDARVLLSLPGVGTVVGATMLSEAWEALERRDYQALRRECGTAPVTHQSGKRLTVSFRRACNQRLRNAVFYLSKRIIAIDARAREHYARLRARGATGARALRGVADRLLKVIVAMLSSGETFDATKRLARGPVVPAAASALA